ncbi:MAG: phage tail family protein [Candidatus Omnitrophica bacterium]|nr:phage tail family protein [Candidatus Omnitrophota bacterium]
MDWIVFKFGNYIFKRPQVLSENIPSRIQQTAIPRRDGTVIVSPIVLESKIIQVQEILVGDSIDNLDTQKKELILELENGENKLWFRNSRYINCVKQNATFDYERGTGGKVLRVTIDFLAVDPFVYDGTETIIDQNIETSPQDIIVFNNGDAQAKPYIKIVAGEDIELLTIINLVNSLTFTYSSLIDGDILEVDTFKMDVLLNSLRNFSLFNGNFIKLNSGPNTIRVIGTTESTFQIKFRGTYYSL